MKPDNKKTIVINPTIDKLTLYQACMVYEQSIRTSYQALCPFISSEKKIIEDYYLKFLGKKKWKEILEVLESLKFGDVEGTKKIVSQLLRDFFKFHVDVHKIAKKDLEHIIGQQYNFNKNFRLPDFWEKKYYSHYVIRV